MKYKAYVADLLKPYVKADTVKLAEGRPMSPTELEAAYKKDPENLDLAARLADLYWHGVTTTGRPANWPRRCSQRRKGTPWPRS